ncbi:MAG: DUF4926 domain-containing protein [Phototrophicaceae bacterium]
MKLYDVVAITIDLPNEHLKRGQVGTIIDQWDDDIYEVEFSDARTGITYAMLALKSEQLMVLYHQLVEQN